MQQNALPPIYPTPGALVSLTAIESNCFCQSASATVAVSWSVRSARWRMVGLPCGQFQGCSTPSSRRTILVRALRSKAVPIITADRHARLANIDTTWSQ